MSGARGTAVAHAARLLERESEVAALASAVDTARAGSGGLVLVEGPAGIGKTTLLAAGRSLAQEAGMAVVRARGTELERGFAFGVVRQLFEPLLRAITGAERAEVLSGPAGVAGAVVGAGVRAASSSEELLPGVLHGMYWLTLNLAERCPLLVLIDDAHWADPPSVRFLSYLAGRLEGVAALAVVAARRADPSHAAGDVVDLLERELDVRVVAVRPLSANATAELLRREYGEEVAPQFAQACHQATGGNPFFLRELMRALRADGLGPTAGAAARVAMEAPASVARSVLTRIGGLSSAAVTVARALAILGGEAELRDVAELTGLDPIVLDDSIDLLAGAGVIVGSEPPAFVHPIVRASIYADIPVGERRRAHASAARMLASRAVAAERVAAHVLPIRPRGDPWTTEVLSQAAGDALSRGAPDAAGLYLIRALAEPPPSRERQQLLAMLGRSQYLAHQPGAADHLIEAMDVTRTATERGELALEAAKALIMAEPDRSEEATQLLDRTIAELGDRDSALSMRLEAQLLAAAGLKLSTRPLHRERMESVYPRALGDDPAERLLLANLADWTLTEGRVPGRFPDLARHAGVDGPPAAVARRVAERAIAGGALLAEQGSDSELFYIATGALCLGDYLDSAEHWLQEAIGDAQKRGSMLGYALASAALAEVAYRRGQLAAAEAHADAAAMVSPSDITAVLTNIMVEQGRLEEAELLLAPYEAAHQGDHLLLQPIHAAAARLRIARGLTREAGHKLLACGHWLEAWGVKNPSDVAWRSAYALALNHPEDATRARDLAAEEVSIARALGQPRTLGIALRALGLLERGDGGIDLLRQAVAELERSPARLEHARALVDYGAALRHNRHRADAREPLRTGLDLAHLSGATALAQRARQELQATGARPRRPMLRGRDALTPTETRVADMAARGLTTREIAQALFVTPKTVETHLSHAYQKLNIHSRAELPHGLSQPQSP